MLLLVIVVEACCGLQLFKTATPPATPRFSTIWLLAVAAVEAVVAVACKLAGVCNLAELFNVPHVELSSSVEEHVDGGGGAAAVADSVINVWCCCCCGGGCCCSYKIAVVVGDSAEGGGNVVCGGPGPMPMGVGIVMMFDAFEQTGYFNMPAGIICCGCWPLLCRPTSMSSKVGIGNKGVLKVVVEQLLAEEDELDEQESCAAVAAGILVVIIDVGIMPPMVMYDAAEGGIFT